MIAATAIFVTYNVRDFARPDLVRHGQSVRTPLWVGPGRKRKSTQPGASGDANQKPRSHDTSRIVWAKLMARVGEKFPLECPACGGDIRLISFITEPGRDRQRFERFAEMCQDPGPENGSRIARVPPASPGGGSNRLTSHSSVGQRLWKCH